MSARLNHPSDSATILPVFTKRNADKQADSPSTRLLASRVEPIPVPVRLGITDAHHRIQCQSAGLENPGKRSSITRLNSADRYALAISITYGLCRSAVRTATRFR